MKEFRESSAPGYLSWEALQKYRYCWLYINEPGYINIDIFCHSINNIITIGGENF